MSIVLSNMFEMSMNKIALWICARVDDWTAKRVIIASNVKNSSFVVNWHIWQIYQNSQKIPLNFNYLDW